MDKQEIGRILAETAFFAELAPEYRDFLAECAEARTVEKDEVLFQYDRRAEVFYLIRSGRITLEIAALEGPPLELQNLSAGQVLGWSWLIPPYKWSFQARAEEPTELLAFDGIRVRERCEQDPAFGYAVLKLFSALMSERLSFAREKMMDEWAPPGIA